MRKIFRSWRAEMVRQSEGALVTQCREEETDRLHVPPEERADRLHILSPEEVSKGFSEIRQKILGEENP